MYPALVPKLSSLKRVFACGEPLGLALTQRFATVFGERRPQLHNLYGPTEATCDVSYFDCTNAEALELVPIGRPIRNTYLDVIDPETGHVMTPGTAGEICIGGVPLARGYLHRADLTAASFVDNPLRSGTRMYRTGDLGSWLPDGNLAFLGRIDGQVKIAGHRIECGEVEHALLRHDAVNEAVVIARSAGDTTELVAYLVMDDAMDIAVLRAHLGATLPQWMIPARFVSLAALPLTSNGKVDKRALPQPATTAPVDSYLPPANAVEEQVAGIWATILRLDRVGVAHDFFALGGDSLKLFRISNRLNDAYPDAITIADLFHHRTVREIAAMILSRRPLPAVTEDISGTDSNGVTLRRRTHQERPCTGSDALGRT